jgi:hypothetical protein
MESLIGLAGVVVGAIVAVTTTLLTARSARKTLNTQLKHTSAENRRALLVDAFAEYLECMETYNLLMLDVSDHVEGFAASHGAAESGEVLEWGDGPALSERDRALWDRWRVVLMRVRLLAPEDVADLADRLFGDYSNDMGDAWLNRPQTMRPQGVHPNHVIRAMQDAIG